MTTIIIVPAAFMTITALIVAAAIRRRHVGWHVHYDDGYFSDPVSKVKACELAAVFGGSVHDLDLCGHG